MKRILALGITILAIGFWLVSCDKESDNQQTVASDNLAIDSLVATKKDIKIWENIQITAYTRGKNIVYQWKANHGSMLNKDSNTVTYWACPSCAGLNTVECTISNEYGSITDTIMINAHF